MRTADGFALAAPAGLGALARAHTVVVPGRDPEAPVPDATLRALRAAHARGARVVSICTGAFVLAAAGLLDGRRATTHWADAARLAARHPAVDVDPAVLYVDGGGGVLTSAGVAAGVDLCLHLVREDYGAAAANAVARRMVVAPHRSGGQAQYAEAPVPAVAGGGLEATRRHMLEHLAEPLTVDALARHAGASRRTFDRRFAAETGTTPLQWLVAQRVLVARRLLETTDAPVARVAALAGFGDPLSLRQHFARATGTSPLAYRRTFRGAAPSTARS